MKYRPQGQGRPRPAPSHYAQHVHTERRPCQFMGYPSEYVWKVIITGFVSVTGQESSFTFFCQDYNPVFAATRAEELARKQELLPPYFTMTDVVVTRCRVNPNKTTK